MKFQSSDFTIGFWHPFGDHAGEDRCEILARKQKEISQNGWTLWSFQYRTKETLTSWYKEILLQKPRRVFVFCSAGKNTKDTKSKAKKCNYFIPINSAKAQKIPSILKVPHPMKTGMKLGTAFIVQNIHSAGLLKPVLIQWYSNHRWEKRKLPTRPEYLIRRGKGGRMPLHGAILELKKPYLAIVGKN